MQIEQRCSTHNTSWMPGRKIEYLVLHYTAGTSSAPGTARQVAEMFASSSREASADFIVDDGQVVQYNGDLTNRYTWAVGGSKYGTMSTHLGGSLYGKCKNHNSISIELCSSKRDPTTLLATDTDWYFTPQVLAHARELVKKLRKQFGIALDHVVMHHHVNGKVCPNPWCVHEKALAGYWAFLASLEEGEEETTVEEVETMVKNLTGEQAYAILKKAEQYAETLPEAEWSRKEGHWKRAAEAGVVDGSGPERSMKRSEVVAVLGRAGLL